jgi:hypothetical protein
VTAKSGDIDGFAAALRFLIANPALRREMGARGQTFVRSQFSRERLIEDIENLYFELTGVEAFELRERNAPFQIQERGTAIKPWTSG